MARVLIVDDQAQNRYLLEILLKGNGYEVSSAGNGEEALTMARETPPDLIVTDILMPVMDGFTLCREWKSDERLKDIPFIFYTATYTDPKDERFALSLGADRFIVKPTQPHVLIQAVGEVIENYHQRKTSPSPPLGEDMEFFRQHNDVLFRKLESKMIQLEKTNRELEHEIGVRTRAEVELSRVNATLETRIQERTAALSAANRELESFAHAVSHDLMAPLRRIDGFSAALAEDYGAGLDQTAQDYLKSIRAGVRGMKDIIDALLHLSTVCREELKKETVDLAALARKVEQLVREDNQGRPVAFVMAPDLGKAQGDPRLISILLHNLLANAWKFTRKRDQPRVELGVERNGGRTTYFVRDNGAGFDMAFAEKLFHPFQRLHPADEFPGVGIGLATAQRIVQRHGGTLRAEGEVDKGATFFFTLGNPDNGTGPDPD